APSGGKRRGDPKRTRSALRRGMWPHRSASASYVPVIPAGTTGAPDRSAKSATPGRPRSSRPRTLKGPSGKMPTTDPSASAPSAFLSPPGSGRSRLSGVEGGGAHHVAGFIARSPSAGEPVASDGGVVLLDRRREIVSAVIHRDEIEILHRRGIERGRDRLEARARDRPRREPRAAVRVE